MAPIMIESPRYAMTGAAMAWQGVRREYDDELLQPLDAPQFLARGSLLAGHQTHDGRQYVCSSVICTARAGL